MRASGKTRQKVSMKPRCCGVFRTQRSPALAPLPLLPLEDPEHPREKLIGGRHVRVLHPVAVARDVDARLGHVGEKGVLAEQRILVGAHRIPRMDRLHLRRGGQDLADLLAGLGDPRIVASPVGPGAGHGAPVLPPEDREMTRIDGEHAMQPRRSGAGRADDHERGIELLVLDLRMPRDQGLGREARDEAPDDPLALRRAAGLGEAGLVVERREKLLHRLAEARVAEVVETGPPAGLREQRIGVEGDRRSHQACPDELPDRADRRRPAARTSSRRAEKRRLFSQCSKPVTGRRPGLSPWGST